MAEPMDLEQAIPPGAPGAGAGAGAAPPDPAGIIEEARRGVANFLVDHRADEVVPESSCVLVLDGAVTLGSALHALHEHKARAAPVADARAARYIALFTVTDVIQALLHFRYVDVAQAFAGVTLRQWADIAGAAAAFVCTDADSNLLRACVQLRDRRVHRLPIVAGGRTVLGTLEHWRVLRFVHAHMAGSAVVGAGAGVGGDDGRSDALFAMTLAELNIGTFGQLVTVSESAKLVDVLEVLVDRNLSAVPVVDMSGNLRSVYARTDITALARASVTNATLEMNVMHALSAAHGRPFRVATCRRSDTLRTVFEEFERTRKHRLYAVDDSGKLIGVLSLSDVLAYFLNGV